MDINNNYSLDFKLSDTKNIAKEIHSSLFQNRETIAFNATVIPTKNKPSTQLKEKLEQFKGQCALTEEVASRANSSYHFPLIAAQHGHANVIAELVQHETDLNQANSNGTTPAWMAAQNGHTNVIAELAKHGVDFQLPFRSSPEFLREFANHYGGNVITRIEAFIDVPLSAAPCC